MKKNYEKILSNVEKELKIIELENNSIIKTSELSIKLINRNLKKIRKSVIATPFKSISEEIEFFKLIKPKLASRLIYYIKVFNIQTEKSQGSLKVKKKYLNNEIQKLEYYFFDNLELYQYFKRKESNLDKQYFLRNKKNIRIHTDSFNSYLDEDFATNYDATFAKFIGYELVIQFLQNEIQKLVTEQNFKSNSESIKSTLNWTGNKVGLVELIYALHTAGVINNGAVDIKELASACERGLNVDLGDYIQGDC